MTPTQTPDQYRAQLRAIYLHSFRAATPTICAAALAEANDLAADADANGVDLYAELPDLEEQARQTWLAEESKRTGLSTPYLERAALGKRDYSVEYIAAYTGMVHGVGFAARWEAQLRAEAVLADAVTAGVLLDLPALETRARREHNARQHAAARGL